MHPLIRWSDRQGWTRTYLGDRLGGISRGAVSHVASGRGGFSSLSLAFVSVMTGGEVTREQCLLWQEKHRAEA